MAIIGFTFTKFEAEKKEIQSGNVQVDNNINVKNIEEFSVNLGGGDQTAIKFTFDFTSTYSPDAGKILLSGEIIDMQDENVIKETVNAWKNQEKVDEKIMEPVMSYILNKCNVQAIILSKDLNLPSPIPLPRIKRKVKKE